VFVAIGIAMLVNRSQFPEMIGQLAQNQGLIFLSGILSLLGGLAIVRVHNIWTGGWPVIVTVLGWLAIIGGLARMWFPHLAAPIAETFAGNWTALLVGGLLVLALGAFLTYKAFGSRAP
jgi:hypothetical protein